MKTCPIAKEVTAMFNSGELKNPYLCQRTAYYGSMCYQHRSNMIRRNVDGANGQCRQPVSRCSDCSLRIRKSSPTFWDTHGAPVCKSCSRFTDLMQDTPSLEHPYWANQ